MRFGISEISWMFPKILRMRRCLFFAPTEVFRGASIALVAMCFPALRGDALVAPRNCFPASAGFVWSAVPGSPLQCVRSVRRSDPVPERTGKAPGARHRAAEPLFVGFGRYSHLRTRRKRGLAFELCNEVPCPVIGVGEYRQDLLDLAFKPSPFFGAR